MLIQLKMLLRELLLPPAGLLLLGVLGLFVLRRRPRLGRSLLIASLATLWCLATPRVGIALYRLTTGFPALDLQVPTAADAIVILGGGSGSEAEAPEWGGLSMSETGWDRVAYGAWLARRTGLPLLVTSTGSDALAMRDTLRRAFGVEARWVDAAARDTFENARNSARLLAAAQLDHPILVTHANHMQRALEEFAATGLLPIPAPVLLEPTVERGLSGWIPSARGLEFSHLAFYEFIGRPVSALLRRMRS